MKQQQQVNIKNKRASFDYELVERFTAGLVLYGTEIKSIREGKASLVDTYCQFSNGELWVRNMQISAYRLGYYYNHDVPIMARIAYDHSTQLILTSDNPRDEQPQDILRDMAAGLTDEELQRVLIIEDRASAIKTACTLARKGDVILVAGKGHEDYQIIKGVKYHFDDHEIVKQCALVCH